MIRVEVFRDARGKVEGFRATGHANAGAYGEDIVCAAVSALTQTALLGASRHLGRELEYQAADGSLQMKLKTQPDALTDAIFETMLLGLNEIADINPRRVRILEHRG